MHLQLKDDLVSMYRGEHLKKKQKSTALMNKVKTVD